MELKQLSFLADFIGRCFYAKQITLHLGNTFFSILFFSDKMIPQKNYYIYFFIMLWHNSTNSLKESSR